MPGPEKILVVEDEAFIAMDIEDMLNKIGFNVRLASNHRQAIEAFSDFCPDIVLMDYYLRGKKSGIETAREIRTLNGGGDVPIVFISAHDRIGESLEEAELENVHFIGKPIAFDRLEALIKSF